MRRTRTVTGHTCRFCRHHTKDGCPYCQECWGLLPVPMQAKVSLVLRIRPSRLSQALARCTYTNVDKWLTTATAEKKAREPKHFPLYRLFQSPES